MLRNRLLKYINITIAFLCALGAAAVYWFLLRVLPEAGGTLTAPVSARASVARDGLGVPHIRAASIEDAHFLHGFITAQDRFFQMEFMRRQAGGELAEIFGRTALESDLESRRLRLRRIAEDHARRLPPGDRAAMAAYARGVNHFLETRRGSLPVEFALLRFDPRPWSLVDSILCGLQMYRSLTTTWRDEIVKRSLLAKGDRGRVDALFPVRTGGEVQPGSNAWALAGRLTSSGRPLLANDPHLQFSLPGVWYQVHLQAPGLNVAGVSLPGLPGVIIGHNERIAWGMTNLHYDAQDLYIEKLDVQTGRYVFRGQPAQAVLERDVVRIRGEAPVPAQLQVTVHGPVFVTDNNQPMALRWAAAEPGFDFPFPELNRAANWSEFRSALARFPGPGQNFVYADIDGNIGYQVGGRLPIRPHHDGDVPADGASGNFEWEGTIPFNDLPSAYNPPSGMIITANQNPFPPDYRYRVNGNFASHYRSRQIQARLSARTGWRAPDLVSVQTDIYSGFSHFLARQVVAACRMGGCADPAQAEAVALLTAWDGQMRAGAPAPLLITLVFQHLRKAVAEKASPGGGLIYETQMAPAVIEDLLRHRPAGWFDDYHDLLRKAFQDAVEEGARMQGRRSDGWDYGRVNQLRLAHPILGGVPVVGGWFRIGPIGMSGSPTTVKQTTPRLGPSMRFVADLADWDRSLMNITTGQSGQPLSSHYKDQWQAYFDGRSFPMQFRQVEAKETLEVLPETAGATHR